MVKKCLGEYQVSTKDTKKAAISKGVENTDHFIFHKNSKLDSFKGILGQGMFSKPVLE